MKKVNFNKLENFEIPESWIENALNAKPKKKPLLLRPYVWGTAASVVLIAAVSLLVLKPFRSSSEPPASVSATAASGTTEQTAATEGTTVASSTLQTSPAKAPAASSAPQTLSTEAPAETEPVPEPTEQTEQTDDPSKFRIKDTWFVDTCAVRSDSTPVQNDTPLLLDKSELFTGDITVTVAPGSEFSDRAHISLEISGYYGPDAQAVGGGVLLELVQGGNGEKTVSFNLFDERAYTPSADYTFRFYCYNDDGSRTEIKTLTEQLYSDNPVTVIL